MKKVNKNFLYNLIYQFFTFIIPLVTVPYISRILGANNIGIYSYTYSIINYFMLASMLGINNYGSKEIAKNSSNILNKSKSFFSIYYLQLICTILMVIFFTFFYLLFDYENKIILLIQVIYLISCAFDINWYFFGVEKFKITISRNIIVKIISIFLIFIFVKTQKDLWIYTLILSCSTLISQLYLWIYLKNEIQFVKVNLKDVFSNLPNCLMLFIPVIAYSIYRVTDKTMIGALADTIQLGNYESAEKIINIPLSIVSALGTVMLPHMAKTNESEFDEKISYTFKLCFFILFPIFIGLMIIATDFSYIFFGKEYIYTPTIIRSLLITILFSGVTNIIRNNYLIPKSKNNIYVKSTIFGAIINIILNSVFIKNYGAYGACIGTIAAEFVVMIYQVLKTRNNIDYIHNIKKTFPFFIKSTIMGGVVYIIGFFIKTNLLYKIIFQLILGVIIYISLNIKYIKYEFFGFNQTKKVLK